MTTNEQYRQAAFHLTLPETRAPDTGAPSPVVPFTPRDAAKALIRPYVLRGDPLDSLKGSLMGSAGADFHAQIGGNIVADGKTKRVKATQIGVSRVGAEPVAAIFSLSALYKEVQAEAAAHAEAPEETDTDRSTLADTTPAERIDRDPDVLPNRRLANDFWPEFQAEWAFRERNGLPTVSPSEFVDMRDWADGVLEPRGVRWRIDAERPAYPEWEPVPDDGEGEEAWADAPRDDRFRRDGKTVFDARQAKLDATIAVLARKVEEIVAGDGYRPWLRLLSKFHTYSANNVALIHAQYPDATQVMGYGNKAGTTGWKSVGRQVRQGEKGITIIRPMHRTIRNAEDETAEPVRILRGFTTATVFDISQTEGIPLPQGPTPEDLPQAEAARSLELDVKLREYIGAWGVRVIRDHETTKRGYWEPVRQVIGIRADLTGVRALKTLAHEAAHMLADHRREGIAAEDAETVAESVAFVLLDHYGIDTSRYSVPYIASWARTPEVVQRNLTAVRDLSHILLTAFGDPCPPPEDREEVVRG